MTYKSIKLKTGIAFLLSCSLGFSVKAQDTALVDKFYISAGVNFWNDYSINTILIQNGIACIGRAAQLAEKTAGVLNRRDLQKWGRTNINGRKK